MIERIKKSEFFSNSLILISGTVLAQLIPIALQPVLRRLFLPSDFGYFAVYSAITGVLIALANLKYESTIVMTESEEGADYLLKGGILISLLFSTLVCVLMFCFESQWKEFFELPDSIAVWFWFIPVSVFALSSYQCMNFWFIRQKKYRLSSLNKSIRRGTEGIGQVTFGASGANGGLIFGGIIGEISNLLTGIFQTKRHGVNWLQFNIGGIQKELARYKRFIVFNAFPSFLNTFSLMFPVIIVSSFYGDDVTGQFDLSRVVLALPLALISVSLSQVYFQKIAEQIRLKVSIFKEYRRLLTVLMILSIPGALIGYFFSDQIFSLCFGENWGQAAKITQLLIFAYAVKFIVSPLSISIIALEKLRWSAAWQLTYFLCILYLFSRDDLSFEEFFQLYAMMEIAIYLVYFAVTYHLVRSYEKSLVI